MLFHCLFIISIYFLKNLKIISILNYIEKTIKIYYENNEKEVITTDNISQVRFYVIDSGRGIGKKNPTLQIFENKEKNAC